MAGNLSTPRFSAFGIPDQAAAFVAVLSRILVPKTVPDSLAAFTDQRGHCLGNRLFNSCFVEIHDNGFGQFRNAPSHNRLGEARLSRELLEVFRRHLVRRQ